MPGARGAGSGSSKASSGAAAAGEGLRHRRVQPNAARSTRPSIPGGGGSGAGMWRFYSDDSPGIKIGPVPVLVMSLVFIFCVFMLHIWGKYTRSS